MKNKEKYAESVLTFACDESGFGVYEKTGEMERCMEMHCTECLFYGKKETCHTSRRKWLESEYIEKPVISKKDRAFLDYLRDRWKYMARDNISNAVYVFTDIPEKGEAGHFAYTGEARRISSDFNVVFPMVKWEDDKPWLIEELKKLEVVDSYE
mgnify:CR=1 FL=1